MNSIDDIRPLYVSDIALPEGASPLVSAILTQEDGPRRHESRVRFAILRATDAAIRFGGDARGIGYLVDYYAQMRGWGDFIAVANEWVRLGQIGTIAPVGLIDGWIPERDRPDYHMWQVAALLRLEADYAPSSVGGFESTVRTAAACDWATRRQQGSGSAWTAAVVEAATRLESWSRLWSQEARQGADVTAAMIAGYYAAHLRSLMALRSAAQAAEQEHHVAAAAANACRRPWQTSCWTADLRPIHPAPPPPPELAPLEAECSRMFELRQAAARSAASDDSIEVTAMAALQWLRRHARAAASDAALSAALDDLARAIGTASSTIAAARGGKARRLQHNVSRIAEHIPDASPAPAQPRKTPLPPSPCAPTLERSPEGQRVEMTLDASLFNPEAM